MGDRGTYRAIKTVLLDGPDYQDLTERARHVFLVLKTNVGMCSGTELHCVGDVARLVSRRCGTPFPAVCSAIRELAGAGFLNVDSGRVRIPGGVKKSEEKRYRGFRRHVGWPEPFPRDRPPTHEWQTIRAAVFERDGHVCRYCGEMADPAECDHVTPVALGGGHGMDNLVTACVPCNRSKGATPVDEWEK